MIVIDLSRPPAEVAALLHTHIGPVDGGGGATAVFSAVRFPISDEDYRQTIDQLHENSIVLTSPELTAAGVGLLLRRETRFRDFLELDRELTFGLRIPLELDWPGHTNIRIGIEPSTMLDEQVKQLRERRLYFTSARVFKQLLPQALEQAAAQNVERKKALQAAMMPTAETAKQRK